MNRVGAVAGIVLLITAAGCGGGLASEAPMDSSTSAASAEDPAATTSPSAGADAAELEASATSLPPGTYTRTGFEPRITLTLDDGWRAVQLLDGFFDVQQDVGSPDVIAVQFANVEGVHGADGSEAADDPTAAVEALRGNPALSVVESSASRIAGLTGEQATVETAGAEHASVIEVPPGPLGIDPGRRLWIAFFGTDDGLLAVMVGGSIDRWDEALATAEPVLESVRIGP